ncbi:MAG: sugar transferase [Thalassovita sp.]
MTFTKRLFDICAALALLLILWPLVIWLSALILIRDGRPVLYLSERMKTPTQGFLLWKFRTMTVVAQDTGVSGGHKASRITRTGAFLRKYRLDEIPQLWNVLRGDISFVGPRPPLRRYVEQFPKLYGEVLKSRPGITGMATLVYHRHEEVLLAECGSAEETEDVYRRRCVPQKARLDLIYQARRSLCLDVVLMLKTVFRRIKIH